MVEGVFKSKTQPERFFKTVCFFNHLYRSQLYLKRDCLAEGLSRTGY